MFLASLPLFFPGFTVLTSESGEGRGPVHTRSASGAIIRPDPAQNLGFGLWRGSRGIKYNKYTIIIPRTDLRARNHRVTKEVDRQMSLGSLAYRKDILLSI